MKLLTKKDARTLPPLYATEKVPLSEKLARLKFFDPCGSWKWYVVEGQATEEGGFEFWGLVDGHEREWGYFTLAELESARGRLGLPIERDLYFEPRPLGAIYPQMEE